MRSLTAQGGRAASITIMTLLAMADPAKSQAADSYKVTVVCDGHASIDNGLYAMAPMLLFWKVSAKSGATDAGTLVGMDISSRCVGPTDGGATEVVLTATGATAVEFIGSCYEPHYGFPTVKAMNSGRLSFPKKFTTIKVATCYQDHVGHNGVLTISISKI